METEKIQKITKNTLEKALEKVGWGVKPHGADTYRLHNPYGSTTEFQFFATKKDEPIQKIQINSFGDNNLFGKADKSFVQPGSGVFYLDEASLVVAEENGEVEYVSLSYSDDNDKSLAFFNFYPKHKSDHE